LKALQAFFARLSTVDATKAAPGSRPNTRSVPVLPVRFKVRFEISPQDGQHWHGPAAGSRLRVNRALLLVPAALNVDQARLEIQVATTERLQLASPHPTTSPES